jgi:hypothetical protein
MPFCTSISAADSVDDAAKLNQDAISRPLDDAAMVQSDSGVKQVAAKSTQPRKRPLLVGTGKLAVSGYIRRKNGRELPGLDHACPLTTRETSTVARRPGQVVLLSR